MSLSPAALWGPLQLTNAAAIVGGAVPVNGQWLIKRAVFTNVTAGPITLTVHLVRSGGSVTAANQLIDAYVLSAGQSYVSPELSFAVLNPGDAIYGFASANTAITTMANGFAQ